MSDSIIEILEMKGINLFILKGKENILIDTGYPGTFDTVVQSIKAKGIDPQSIKFILITHDHHDHFGNIFDLKELTGAQVAIHKKGEDNLRNGANGALKPVGLLAKILSMFLKNTTKRGVQADILIEDEFDLNQFGIKGKIIQTPGHTPTCLSVVLDSGEVIAGDMLFDISKRRKPSYSLWVYDLDLLKQSIRKILEYKPKIIYASHGGPFTPESVASFVNS